VRSLRPLLKFVVWGALALPANGVVAATACDVLATQLMEIHPDLGKLFTEVKRPGSPTCPRRKDAEVAGLRSPAKTRGPRPRYQEGNRISSKLEQLDRVIGEFGTTVERDGIYQKLADPGPPVAKSYAPTEYDLKSLYQNLVLKLNEQLPQRLRLAVRQLVPDERPVQLKGDAETLVKTVAERFERLLPTAGHQSLAKFRETYGSNAARKRLLDIMAEERFQMTIRRPENARWWVPKVGFQNQFVTGTSKGYYTPSGRNHVEAGGRARLSKAMRSWTTS